ncbi:MAG: carboxylesterase family protein [Gemmatimonadetes bacterium]|nr:carboxylesterase family protein [Gemmatimonadota bacterium]
MLGFITREVTAMRTFAVKGLFAIAVVSLAFPAAVFAVDAAVQLTQVELTYGQVSGVELDGDVTVFRGIPFAAPPVGDLRWKAPQPPIPWQGVRAADTFGATCMQRGRSLMSEDCLYLNVWTEADSNEDNLPVMVWIHGGGWTGGASSNGTYDGSAFAEKGVVLVSVNYRMSAFGFMAHPALSAESDRGVSGNYGILDHVAALEWVRDNITGFGGDPDNVTIFGESAGGASIYALLATPLAEGLFQRAISESTWITPTNVTHLKNSVGFVDGAEAQGQRAIAAKFSELGTSVSGNVADEMRALSAADVMSMRFSVSLVEDGYVIPKAPGELFSEGSQNVVPLLAGINSGEGLFFVRPNSTFSTVAEQREARLEEWGTLGRGLADHYLADSDEDVFTSEVDYNTDLWFARPNREILDAMANTSANSFMYVFTRNLRDPSERAPHAMELRYVFNTLPESASQVDRDIADLISDYWVQFATTGNPNREGLPYWPAYDIETRQYQTIGVDVGQGSNFRGQELDALDRYFEATYQQARSSAR